MLRYLCIGMDIRVYVVVARAGVLLWLFVFLVLSRLWVYLCRVMILVLMMDVVLVWSRCRFLVTVLLFSRSLRLALVFLMMWRR